MRAGYDYSRPTVMQGLSPWSRSHFTGASDASQGSLSGVSVVELVE